MNILVSGIGGKMGRVLYAAIAETEGITAVCGVDKFADPARFDLPVFKSFAETAQFPIDCIIDFSVREAVYDILPYAIERSIPCVLATTGYSGEELGLIQKAASHIPIFRTGNMSLGVNVLSKLAALATAMLGDRADIEITETHHNQKIDAPSGTALLLLDAVKSAKTPVTPIHGRSGMTGKRTKEEVAVHAIRGGTVVGKHEVSFFLNNEVITIRHEAESKTIFANGSIKAAFFLQGQPAGMYDMNDLLG